MGAAGDLEGRTRHLGRHRARNSRGPVRLRRRGADIPRFMDAAAPGVLVAQAIGRVGNYFNQELFGGPTSLPWGLRIDSAHRPSAYAQFVTFQPTFLYELIWNLALAGALIWLGHRRRIRAPGLFALYVTGYSGFRVFEELLRVDPAHHVFGLRLNFFVAALLCGAGLVWFVRIQGGSRARRHVSSGTGPAALGAAWLICALTGCGHGPDLARSAAAASAHRDKSSPQTRSAATVTAVPAEMRYLPDSRGRSR